MARSDAPQLNLSHESFSDYREAIRAEISRSVNTEALTKASENDRIKDQILDVLAQLGGLTVGDDSLKYEGTQFVIPAHMEGNLKGARQYLSDYENQQEKEFQFSKKFNYRPWDGAHAFESAMTKTFGSVGIGKSVYDMFGQEYKPEFRTVSVSHNSSIQVPWGHVAFSPLSATFMLSSTRHADYGIIFELGVEAPRKYRRHIEAFFQVVEEELKTNSIYRGKAFTGGMDPLFLNTREYDPDKVVYSEKTLKQLETNLWSLMRYSDTMRENKLPLKRSVLLEGPYGTGKTLAGQLTAKEAVDNGWTFIQARTGRDDLNEVLQTAQLYAPAVVWYEDIDIVAKGKSNEQVSQLLDSLDGITNKGIEILAGFTTNHIEEIQKGVLRPGRLDAVIEVGGLDLAGFEKLIRVVVPEKLLGEVDFKVVADAMDGYLPAFAKESIDRSIRYSISRNQGQPDVITTQDLVDAAEGLRPQWNLMQKANEGVVEDSLTTTVAKVLTESLNGTKILDGDGDSPGYHWHLDTAQKFDTKNED